MGGLYSVGVVCYFIRSIVYIEVFYIHFVVADFLRIGRFGLSEVVAMDERC